MFVRKYVLLVLLPTLPKTPVPPPPGISLQPNNTDTPQPDSFSTVRRLNPWVVSDEVSAGMLELDPARWRNKLNKKSCHVFWRNLPTGALLREYVRYIFLLYVYYLKTGNKAVRAPAAARG